MGWAYIRRMVTDDGTIEQNEYLSFAYSFDEKLRKKLWLEAWEQTYTDRLSQKIISKQRETGT
nr:hypothetical protein P5658_02190 [Bacillus subtilis]